MSRHNIKQSWRELSNVVQYLQSSLLGAALLAAQAAFSFLLVQKPR